MPEMCNKQWEHSQHAQLHTSAQHTVAVLQCTRDEFAVFLLFVLNHINHVPKMRNSYEKNVSIDGTSNTKINTPEVKGAKHLYSPDESERKSKESRNEDRISN